MPVISIATSLVTLVGMFYGAKRLDLVRQITYYAMSRSALIGGIMGILFFVLAEPLISMFTVDYEILETGVQYLRYFVFAYPFIPIGMTSGRMLQGLGYGFPMLALTFLRVLLISVTLALLFVFLMNKPIEWIWISQVTAVICSSGISFIWLRLGLRRTERSHMIGKDSVTTAILTGGPGQQVRGI